MNCNYNGKNKSGWSKVKEALGKKMNDFTPHKVLDHLYISNIFSVVKEVITERNIKLIINLTKDTPFVEFEGVKTLKFNIEDDLTSDIKSIFHQCADEIQATADSGYSTLVHCIAGVSRSATICLAYLMKYQHMTLLEAYKYLKKCRPMIRPNSNFFQQLIAFESELYEGRTTVNMISTDIGRMPDVYDDSSGSAFAYFLPLSRTKEETPQEPIIMNVDITPENGTQPEEVVLHTYYNIDDDESTMNDQIESSEEKQ